MTEPKFTPGPWSDCRGSIGLFDEYGEYEIADVLMTCTGMTLEEWRANCRLIEAAPEMYDALKTVLGYLRSMYGWGADNTEQNPLLDGAFDPDLYESDGIEARDRIRALLARVDGEESK